MQEIKHKEQRVGENLTYKMLDIYVKDVSEALTVDTALLLQGSKMLIIETMELFVLNEDGGVWYSASDGSVLK